MLCLFFFFCLELFLSVFTEYSKFPPLAEMTSSFVKLFPYGYLIFRVRLQYGPSDEHGYGHQSPLQYGASDEQWFWTSVTVTVQSNR